MAKRGKQTECMPRKPNKLTPERYEQMLAASRERHMEPVIVLEVREVKVSEPLVKRAKNKRGNRVVRPVGRPRKPKPQPAKVIDWDKVREAAIGHRRLTG